MYGNPSSPHKEGSEARAALEDARVRIARLAGVKAEAVIFTAGATEANALALVGQVDALRAAGVVPGEIHVLYLPSAHASIRETMRVLAAEGIAVEALVVRDGAIDTIALAKQVRPQTRLVALEAVCGETGAQFDTRAVRRVLDAEGEKAARIHVDASQLPRAGSFERTRLAADTVALDAQKVGGVRGIGALIVPRSVVLTPRMHGGGQERGLRPGTESPALAAAFASALEEADAGRVSFCAHAARARSWLLEQIAASVPNVVENGGASAVPHILNISLPGRDTDYLAALLDEAGFAVSTRSACATDADGSVAVLAFTADAARAASTLRISWGPQTHMRDLDRFARALIRAVRFLDAYTV